jgi:hypothetical protein
VCVSQAVFHDFIETVRNSVFNGGAETLLGRLGIAADSVGDTLMTAFESLSQKVGLCGLLCPGVVLILVALLGGGQHECVVGAFLLRRSTSSACQTRNPRDTWKNKHSGYPLEHRRKSQLRK